MKKLTEIQSELKAPKNQFNAFGKYKYRSCEDILEAVKPLLKKYGCVLTITDEVFCIPYSLKKEGMEIDNLVYIQSVCTFSDGEKETIVKAQAGVDINRKGMDVAQCFGASSSYARKYALNGLFLIDDNKESDPDTKNDMGAEKPELKPGHVKWEGAKKSIKEGKVTISAIRKSYLLTKENEKKLCS